MSEAIAINGNTEPDIATPRPEAVTWPDQVFYDENGEIELRTPEMPHRFGNPEAVVAPHTERLVQSILENDAVIVRSPTGTGKTTELMLAVMESGHFDQVITTQPRIVAARSITQYLRTRIADVIGEDAARSLAGWHTAPDSDFDQDLNQLLNVTDGIPLRRMISGDSLGEGSLLVIDEIHEDKINMHLLLFACKKFGIKVVVMSATVDVDEKARYLAGPDGAPAPIIDIEGTTHPIEERAYAKDAVTGKLREATEEERESSQSFRDAFDAVKEYSSRQLDILLFVPDIKDTKSLAAKVRRYVPSGYTILTLHGGQTPNEQAAALSDYPGGKVIIATSIAMTSLTPKVDVVLDSGWSRGPQLDRGDDTLSILPSSIAERDQRRGRCGRTREGISEMVCVPGYPNPLQRSELKDFSLPEILSTRPDETILKLAKMGVNNTEGLMVAPDAKETELAIRRVSRLGAMALKGYASEGMGELTPIGDRMVELPLDVNAARMMVESYHYSKVVQLQMAATVAVWQAGGIQAAGMNRRQMLRHTRETGNDLLAGLDMFIAAAKMSPEDRVTAGFSEQKFSKAWSAYEGIATRHLNENSDTSDIDDITHKVVLPTDEERAQLQACMIAGIDEVYRGRDDGKLVSRGKHIRSKSSMSLLYVKKGDLVAGVPYNVDRIRKGKRTSQELNADGTPKESRNGGANVSTMRLVTSAFKVDIQSLRDYAPDRISDTATGVVRLNEEGRLEEQVDVLFDGKSLNQKHWRDAELTATRGSALIDSALRGTHVGHTALPESIIELRRQIADLRDLQHKTRFKIDIDAAVEKMKALIAAQTEDDAIEFSKDLSVTFDSTEFLSDKERQSILEQAPMYVEIPDINTGVSIEVPVVYYDGDAYITLQKSNYGLLGQDIAALRGRKVMVRPVGGQKYIDQATAFEQRGKSRQDARGNFAVDSLEQARRRDAKQVDAQVAVSALRGHASKQQHLYNALKRTITR